MTVQKDLRTDELQVWVDELRAGRPETVEPVLRLVVDAVGRQARAMLRRFPRAGRVAEAEDVVQSALIRLLAALRTVRPESTRHFYALANTLIRRELLDLTGRYRPAPPLDDAHEPAAPDLTDLDALVWFHSAVERLPVEEREALGLTHYHGWSQQQIAELFGVNVRTVQRWLASATAALRREAEAV